MNLLDDIILRTTPFYYSSPGCVHSLQVFIPDFQNTESAIRLKQLAEHPIDSLYPIQTIVLPVVRQLVSLTKMEMNNSYKIDKVIASYFLLDELAVPFRYSWILHIYKTRNVSDINTRLKQEWPFVEREISHIIKQGKFKKDTGKNHLYTHAIKLLVSNNYDKAQAITDLKAGEFGSSSIDIKDFPIVAEMISNFKL